MTIITNGANIYLVGYFVRAPSGTVESETKKVQANSYEEAKAILRRQLGVYMQRDRRWSYWLEDDAPTTTGSG